MDGDNDIDPKVRDAIAGLPSDFSSFPKIYSESILPALLNRERDRVSAVKEARTGWITGGAGGALGALAGFGLAGLPLLGILAIVVGAGWAFYRTSALRHIGKEAKTLLVQPVAQEFGLVFDERPGEQGTVYDFRRARLLPSWDRSNFEDRLTGQRGDVDFEFFEAHLEERRTTRDSKGRTQTRWVTVFRGQCIRFDFHKQFYGETLVARDSGIFNRFGGGGDMKRAKLEDPKFEKAFEVYTTDQVEARFLLTPDFMQKLVDLEEAFHGGKLRCAFVGGEMFVALEGGDLFEPGSMFRRLDDPNRIRELLDDFAAVFHLIDTVSSNRARRKEN
ncbi:MAG: DUF3137 domain-containing protein [Pseudomonadota bacterium]